MGITQLVGISKRRRITKSERKTIFLFVILGILGVMFYKGAQSYIDKIMTVVTGNQLMVFSIIGMIIVYYAFDIKK